MIQNTIRICSIQTQAIHKMIAQEGDDTESSWNGLIIAAVVVILGYFFFFPGEPENEIRGDAPQQQRHVQRGDRQFDRAAARPHDDDEDGIQTFLRSHVTKPPHYSAAAGSNSSSQHFRPASDGVLPFKYTKAATFEQGKNDPAESLQNRKDRARMFAKMFANSKADPPAKGKNMVVSIPSSDNENERVHRVLYLLGTYYNLFVMVNIDGEDYLEDYAKDRGRTDAIISKFYSSTALQKEVLPPHRIVVTRSLSSRIAFVRSFPKSPDLVVGSDDESEWSAQLTKFGYTVILRSLASL